MHYNCVIIDDEQHAIDLLNDYIQETAFLKVSRTFINPIKALESICVEDEIDFLFLDIDMNGIKGTDLSVKFRNMAKYIVFASSNLEQEINADNATYECYLGKPISPKKFINSIMKLVARDNSSLIR